MSNFELKDLKTSIFKKSSSLKLKDDIESGVEYNKNFSAEKADKYKLKEDEEGVPDEEPIVGSSYSSSLSLSASESAILETNLVVETKPKQQLASTSKKITDTLTGLATKASNLGDLSKKSGAYDSEKTKFIHLSSSNEIKKEDNSPNPNTTPNTNNINTSDSGIGETNRSRSKSKTKNKKYSSSKQRLNKRLRRGEESGNQAEQESTMCCNKKCTCVAFIAIYISFDVLFNAFFVTSAFTKQPAFSDYTIESSLVDVWLISVARDLVLTFVILMVGIRHQLISGFVKFVHKKYISSFLCLVMYSFAMIKMLIHADKRVPDRSSMIMFIWNIFAGILFFISWYMLALLKSKSSNYQKTDVDGGDLGDNAPEEDILINTLKETQKKRSSLLRLFKYSKADWLYLLAGTLFLIVGAICEAFVPYYTGQVLDSIIVVKNFSNFKTNAILFISAHFIR